MTYLLFSQRILLSNHLKAKNLNQKALVSQRWGKLVKLTFSFDNEKDFDFELEEKLLVKNQINEFFFNHNS